MPLPRDVGDMAAIYFKKALLDCEAEWSMNKKVVDLKGKNIRKGVPKGLPYFWIDFGMDPGFAHVIEDQQLFPRTFAEVYFLFFVALLALSQSTVTTFINLKLLFVFAGCSQHSNCCREEPGGEVVG